jgi:hypothetical protein
VLPTPRSPLLFRALLAIWLAARVAAAQEPPPPEEPASHGGSPDAAATGAAPGAADGGGPGAEQAPEVAPAPPPEPQLAPPSRPPSPPSPDRVFSGRPEPQAAGQQEEHSWFDTGRSYVGRLFFAPVVRLDRFFSDQSELDPDRARSFARLRTGLQLREDGKPVTSIDLVADLHFPGVNSHLDRFRLVVAGAADSVVGGLYSTYGASPPFSFSARDRTSNAELRFGAYQGLRSSVDLGAGVLFRLPVGAFTRLRYRLAVPIHDRLVGRASTSGFWRTDTHLGTRVDAALEWPPDPSTMIRLGSSATAAQRKTNGIDYGLELVVSRAFTPTSALAFGMDGVGSSRAPVGFERYRAFARLRHDVLRRWIFLEVEPEAAWPWTPERGRYQALGVTFRLEVQLEGAGAAELAARDRPQPAAPPLSPP